MSRPTNYLVALAFLVGSTLPLAPARASTNAQDSAVIVICDNRQGSGTVLAGGNGYILTAGHVVESPDTKAIAASCKIAFNPAADGTWGHVLVARVVFAEYDERLDRDFAMLQVAPSDLSQLTMAGLKVSETVAVGDTVTFLGYPNGVRQVATATGHILGFRRGVIRTDAVIAEGNSGGPIVDGRGRLIGIATRLIVVTHTDGTESVEDYEAADLLSIENWLDTEQGGHDRFLLHDDPSFVHGSIPLVRSEESPCIYLVRTQRNPAVYCLVPGMRRLAFPMGTVYRSWYSDFGQVKTTTDQVITQYQLVANMTFKVGSLVKIATDPKVYYVADNMGTLRWITTESAAARLAGADWSKQVKDVPDTFFLNYRVGRPLD